MAIDLMSQLKKLKHRVRNMQVKFETFTTGILNRGFKSVCF